MPWNEDNFNLIVDTAYDHYGETIFQNNTWLEVDGILGDYNSVRFVKFIDGINEIGDSAFEEAQFTFIFIPTSVKIIGTNAFKGSKLKYALIPEGVKTIKTGAFAIGIELRQIVLSSTVKTIEENAFIFDGIYNYDTKDFDSTTNNLLSSLIIIKNPSINITGITFSYVGKSYIQNILKEITFQNMTDPTVEIDIGTINLWNYNTADLILYSDIDNWSSDPLYSRYQSDVLIHPEDPSIQYFSTRWYDVSLDSTSGTYGSVIIDGQIHELLLDSEYGAVYFIRHGIERFINKNTTDDTYYFTYRNDYKITDIVIEYTTTIIYYDIPVQIIDNVVTMKWTHSLRFNGPTYYTNSSKYLVRYNSTFPYRFAYSNIAPNNVTHIHVSEYNNKVEGVPPMTDTGDIVLDFTNLYLPFVDFSGTFVEDVNFSNSKLYSANFNNCQITRAVFDNIDTRKQSVLLLDNRYVGNKFDFLPYRSITFPSGIFFNSSQILDDMIFAPINTYNTFSLQTNQLRLGSILSFDSDTFDYENPYFDYPYDKLRIVLSFEPHDPNNSIADEYNTNQQYAVITKNSSNGVGGKITMFVKNKNLSNPNSAYGFFYLYDHDNYGYEIGDSITISHPDYNPDDPDDTRSKKLTITNVSQQTVFSQSKFFTASFANKIILEKTLFQHCSFINCNFYNVKLLNVDFSSAVFTNTYFYNVLLSDEDGNLSSDSDQNIDLKLRNITLPDNCVIYLGRLYGPGLNFSYYNNNENVTIQYGINNNRVKITEISQYTDPFDNRTFNNSYIDSLYLPSSLIDGKFLFIVQNRTSYSYPYKYRATQYNSIIKVVTYNSLDQEWQDQDGYVHYFTNNDTSSKIGLVYFPPEHLLIYDNIVASGNIINNMILMTHATNGYGTPLLVSHTIPSDITLPSQTDYPVPDGIILDTFRFVIFEKTFIDDIGNSVSGDYSIIQSQLNLSNISLQNCNFTSASISNITVGVDENGTLIDDSTDPNSTIILDDNMLVKSGNLFAPAIKFNQYNCVDLDLTNVDLSNGDGSYGDYTNTIFKNANLSNTTLNNSIFMKSLTSLVQVDFRNANLTNANLQNCNFNQVNFSNANLYGANLSYTQFNIVDLTSATLTNANLNGLSTNNISPSDGFGVTLPENYSIIDSKFVGKSLISSNITFDTDMSILDLNGTSSTYTTFDYSTFTVNTKFGKNIEYINFLNSSTNITSTNFQDVYVDCFKFKQISNVNFSSTLIFQYIRFNNSILTNVNFSNRIFDHVFFDNCTLDNVNFTNCKGPNNQLLNSTNLSLKNIKSLNITNVTNFHQDYKIISGYIFGPYIDLQNVNIEGLDLSNIDFTGIKSFNISPSDGTGVTLPDGFIINNGYIIGPGVNLAHASFTDTLDLTGLDLSNTFLKGIDTNSNIIPSDGNGVLLPTGYKIINGFLFGENSRLNNKTISNITINANNLIGVDFSNTQFTNVIFGDSQNTINLSYANFINCEFINCKFIKNQVIMYNTITGPLTDINKSVNDLDIITTDNDSEPFIKIIKFDGKKYLIGTNETLSTRPNLFDSSQQSNEFLLANNINNQTNFHKKIVYGSLDNTKINLSNITNLNECVFIDCIFDVLSRKTLSNSNASLINCTFV